MSDRTFEDAFNLLCGAKIGEGIHRKVFVCNLDPSLVVKVEDDEHRAFSNIREYHNWDECQYYKPVADWLAPCTRLSPDGRLLLQKRATPMRPEDMPKEVPKFLTDIKWENFGWLNGRVVCTDYPQLITNIPKGVKAADW